MLFFRCSSGGRVGTARLRTGAFRRSATKDDHGMCYIGTNLHLKGDSERYSCWTLLSGVLKYVFLGFV